MASNEKSTCNKEKTMIITIIAIIKIIIETIYIFTGDRKQKSFFATDQIKKKISTEPAARYNTDLLANCFGSKPYR